MFAFEKLMSFASWYLRSVNGVGCWKLLIKELEHYKISVCSVQETKSPWLLQFDVNSFHVYHSKASTTIGGVALVIRKMCNIKVLTAFNPISNRITYLHQNGVSKRAFNFCLCICYRPVCFQSRERAVLWKTKPSIWFITNGEDVFNGRFLMCMWVMMNKWADTIGEFNLPQINSNSELLLSFFSNRAMKILNTYFQHKLMHKVTWQNTLYKSPIDFFISFARIFKSITLMFEYIVVHIIQQTTTYWFRNRADYKLEEIWKAG